MTDKMLWPHQKSNLLELTSVLRAFDESVLSEGRPGTILGHHVGIAFMVLAQRHVVVAALQHYLDKDGER